VTYWFYRAHHRRSDAETLVDIAANAPERLEAFRAGRRLAGEA
jgi:hypothetical protein